MNYLLRTNYYDSAKIKSGFTLVELMIVIALGAILATVAAPSMKGILEKNKVEAHVQNLRAAVGYARTEAANRGSTVVICGRNGTSDDCSDSNDWSTGWIIFEDNTVPSAYDPTVTGDDEIIRVFEYRGRNTVGITEEDAATGIIYLAFDSRGYARSFDRDETTALVKICPVSNNDIYARAVVIGPSGRAIVSRDGSGDGVHEHTVDDGQGTVVTNALACP